MGATIDPMAATEALLRASATAAETNTTKLLEAFNELKVQIQELQEFLGMHLE